MIDPQIHAGAQRQAELEAAKAAFFMSGGQVQECGLCETAPHKPASWNGAITQRKDARRSFTEKERQLAGLIRGYALVKTAHGDVRRTAVEVRNKLRTDGEKLTTPQVEQIAAKFQIVLAFGGSKF
jgi:hypothetical protein